MAAWRKSPVHCCKSTQAICLDEDSVQLIYEAGISTGGFRQSMVNGLVCIDPLILGQNFPLVSWNISYFLGRAYQLLFQTRIEMNFGSGAPNESVPSYKNLGNDT